MKNSIQRLQTWFAQYCNGEWEHQKGIRIETLDNPGWAVTINLKGTILQNRSFQEISTDRTELDWINCMVRDDTFVGYGGTENLDEILDIFLQWNEAEKIIINEAQ